jgi:predicted esterase
MKNKILFFALFLLSINLFSQPDIAKKFKYRSQKCSGVNILYRLFIPEKYDSLQKYPLILALHGSGERGSDNEIQLIANRLGTLWADTEVQNNSPCFVVVPQCPLNGSWIGTYSVMNIDQIPITKELNTVNSILDSLLKEFNIDPLRLYVTGLSMGGYGTWDLITRFPNRFAAAVPICGGGDPLKASAIKIPIWDFHGQADNSVPVEMSRMMIRSLESAGRKTLYTHCKLNDCTGLSVDQVSQQIINGADLLYSEFKDVGHSSWVQAFNYPLLIPFIFKQKKQLGIKSAGVNQIISFTLFPNYPNPFNPYTNIRYTINSTSKVTLKIYDILGREIRTLIDEIQTAGEKTIQWNAANNNGKTSSSGIYMYSLRVNNAIKREKMMYLK